MPELFLAPTYYGGTGRMEKAIASGLSGHWRVHHLEYPRSVTRAPGGEAFADIVKASIAQIEAVKTGDPLFIAGFSFGGHVAFEVAAAMERAGKPVAFVGVLSAFAFPDAADIRQPGLFDTLRSFVRSTEPADIGRVSAMMGRPRIWARAFQHYVAMASADMDRPWLNEALLAGLRFLRLEWRAEQFAARSNRVYRLKSVAAFRASRYTGRVWLLRPERVPPPPRPNDLGWSALGAVVEVKCVALPYMTFWEFGNLPLISANLDDALNAALNDPLNAALR